MDAGTMVPLKLHSKGAVTNVASDPTKQPDTKDPPSQVLGVFGIVITLHLQEDFQRSTPLRLKTKGDAGHL